MRSDKGQQSVLYIEDYEKGMHKLLSDRGNYKIDQADPTKTIAAKTNKFINKLFHKKIIDKSEKFNWITALRSPLFFRILGKNPQQIFKRNI
jgi:hypothetical protein